MTVRGFARSAPFKPLSYIHRNPYIGLMHSDLSRHSRLARPALFISADRSLNEFPLLDSVKCVKLERAA